MDIIFCLLARIRGVSVRGILLENRIASGIPFTSLLSMPLPFKIPIMIQDFVDSFPAVFELGMAEYSTSIDTWLVHRLLSYTSEQAVLALDAMWQTLFNVLAMADILLDEHDESSEARYRPDFTVMHNGVLVMKGEAKAILTDMRASCGDLIRKFHSTAYKLFPRGISSIPAVLTCNTKVQLFSLSHFNKKYDMALIKQYDVVDLRGRVDFICDIFRLLIWTVSQVEPVEGFHLPPGVRIRTRNGHHVTSTADGILKELDRNKLHEIKMDLIRKVYSLKLPNVEFGTVNETSLTIARVGCKLSDAIRVRHLNKKDIFIQVSRGVEQLHANGFAHCDICVDNIFVDSLEDGGQVFLGDLEYCCLKDSKPRPDIRRADRGAKTAEALDNIQLAKLKDELASF